MIADEELHPSTGTCVPRVQYSGIETNTDARALKIEVGFPENECLCKKRNRKSRPAAEQIVNWSFRAGR